MPRLGSGVLLSLLIAASASAVTVEWTFVGDAGNACDAQLQGCYGAVGYEYAIGTYEVTNAQYAEFLNAKAASDPLGLYGRFMDPTNSNWGGIARSGADGGYVYTAVADRAQMPVNNVSFYDALRFANWMNNHQGNGDTETGAYTLLGGSEVPSNGTVVVRNAGANIFLTSEDEWYKAAYYDAATASYFDYPTRSDTHPVCSAPNPATNQANCGNAVGNLTIVGSYAGSASPYGTFDQGGNVWEWNETIKQFVASRGLRGGAFGSINGDTLNAWHSAAGFAAAEDTGVGFRIAMIPEPGTGALVLGGLLGLAAARKESGEA